MSSDLRANARIWFSAEYVSLWGPPHADADPAADTQVDSPAREPSHPQHQGANFFSFMEHLAHLQQPVSDDDDEDDKIQSEAEMYLELPDEPMTTDVLKWWAAHESVFPRLSRMARQYLGCPATSASAERLFSIAGRAFDDMRQGMDDGILEMLMWARVNRETRQ